MEQNPTSKNYCVSPTITAAPTHSRVSGYCLVLTHKVNINLGCCSQSTRMNLGSYIHLIIRLPG